MEERWTDLRGGCASSVVQCAARQTLGGSWLATGGREATFQTRTPPTSCSEESCAYMGEMVVADGQGRGGVGEV